MRKVFYAILAVTFIAVLPLSAAKQKKNKKNNIYELPPEEPKVELVKNENFILAGSESGLYKIFENKTAVPLNLRCQTTKILKTVKSSADENGNIIEKTQWYFVTSQGIMTSSDLEHFEERNSGLPLLTIKEYKNGETSFKKQVAQIKDLSVHPENPDVMVTATKDNVYITYDGALSWENIGSMSKSTSGVKAVAVCNMPKLLYGKETGEKEMVVFMTHPIFGFSYYLPERKNPVWNDINAGFEMLKTLSYPEELSDLLPIVRTVKNEETGEEEKITELLVSQAFIPRVYRYNWKTKRAEKIYGGKEPTDTIDGLSWNGKEVIFARPGEVAAFEPKTFRDVTTNPSVSKPGAKDEGEPYKIGQDETETIANQNSLHNPSEYIQWKDTFWALAPKDTLYCAYLKGFDGSELALNELWLLRPEISGDKYSDKAGNIKAVYIPANKVCTQKGIDDFKKILKDNNLNAIVIDMKDDYGLLRYDTKDPLVLEKGYVSKYSVNLDDFVKQFKDEGIYLIARIVSFKDKHLSLYDGGKYAVWDKTTGKPWVGTKGYEDIKNSSGEVTGKKQTYYDENWCDPYSPEVWEYNVAIAKELVSRGFDEIQYDYIRFPTDGLNMRNAKFRWQSEGMDKESALISFLSYARENIDAPIGIDIYGANGWYRSGTRTGQDVELLAQYVDVICPMFYPSHFEQAFLNYSPWSERPYRIYFYGTYRNTVIGRNRIIVRPWVQAFYIGVSYDKQFYDKDYVQREIYGVRDSVNSGYMYWNNIGRYEDIRPDVGNSVYPWSAQEASSEFKKPAFSGGETKPKVEESIKIEMKDAKEDSENNNMESDSPFSYLDFSLKNIKLYSRKKNTGTKTSQSKARIPSMQ